MTTEIVLPDGRFARIRPMKVRDVSLAQQFPSELFMPALIARTVTLDGEALTVGDVLEMEFFLALPIYEIISKQMKQAMKTKDGVV